MLMSRLGQAFAIEEANFVEQSDLLSAPIFLTATSFNARCLPKSWCGRVYSSEAVLDGVSKKYAKMTFLQRAELCPLLANATFPLRLSESLCYQVTMLNCSNLDANGVIFFFTEGTSQSQMLLSGYLPDIFGCFHDNSDFRRQLARAPIRVLYIDDTVFLDESRRPRRHIYKYPSELQLRMLAYVVRPMQLKGMHNANMPAQFHHYLAIDSELC